MGTVNFLPGDGLVHPAGDTGGSFFTGASTPQKVLGISWLLGINIRILMRVVSLNLIV